MSFTSSRTVKRTARNHLCLWCSIDIPKHSEAIYEAWHWEGDFNHGYFHPECVHARTEVFATDRMARQEGVEYGNWGRGRTDDESAPAQFAPNGDRLVP